MKKKRWLLSSEATSKADYLFFFYFPLISKQLLDTENNKNKTEQTNKKKRTRDIAGKKRQPAGRFPTSVLQKKKRETA